jgi:hypothetical protein
MTLRKSIKNPAIKRDLGDSVNLFQQLWELALYIGWRI